jgi:hypothetical protein
VGKYDLTVTSGPSFTTRRQEAAEQMTELLRAFPAAAPVIGGLLAKNLDWPGADEIAKRLDAIWEHTQGAAAQAGQGIPPEVQQAFAKMQQQLQSLQQQNAALQQKHDVEVGKLQVSNFEANTDRMRAVHEITKPPEVRTANG